MKSSLGLEAKLPVFDLLKEAIVLLWAKRNIVIPMFLPVIFVLATVDFISEVYFSPVVTDDAQVVEADPMVEAGQSMKQLGMSLIAMLFSILMATAAHRFTLLPRDQWYTNGLHGWGKDEWRYLGRAVVIGFIAGIAALVPFFIGAATGSQEGMAIGGTIGGLIAMYLFGRLSITLPEVAIGKQGDLKRAWALSEGNGTRMVIVVLLIPIAMIIPAAILYWLESHLATYFALLVVYVGSLISVTILSLSYQFLIDFYEPESLAPEVLSEELEQPAEKEGESGRFDA